MKTGLLRDAQQMKQCVYSIPCDCGRCYIGETSRPSQVRIKDHKYNLTKGLLEKSKFAQRAYKSHNLCWKEAKVLQIEPNTTYRKYKESARMSLLDHPISQPSLDISPIWTPVITAEVRKPQFRTVWIVCENCHVGTLQRICLFCDGFYSDSALILTVAVE
jgi:predicted GIY-YIG superfamily endonuclease